MVVKNDGQPVPLSYFISEVNSGRPQPAQTNTPGRFSPFERAGAGALGVLLAQHAVGGGLQALLPLVLGELQLLGRAGHLGARGEQGFPVVLHFL